ncbi:MAG TPA: NAD(P)/FAD-dependent oxidoreductase [Oculatellaceae cyanobacterium]
MNAPDKPNNIVLPNLNIRDKVLSTLAIALSEIGIIASWIVILHVVPPDAHPHHTMSIHLKILASSNKLMFALLFFLHAGSMILMLASTYRLFKKTSIRRRTKTVIITLTIALTLLDLLTWTTSQFGTPLSMAIAPVGVFASLMLILQGLVPLWQIWIYKRWLNRTGKTVRVVIVGGGFAGLYAALTLNEILGYHPQLDITLLDCNNYFLFSPLLPSAAVGTIELAELSFPFRSVFDTTNIIYKKAAVTRCDLTNRLLCAETISQQSQGREKKNHSFDLSYDYLVLCPGSVNSSLKARGVDHHAFFLKKLEDAFILRNHIINCFEVAASEQDHAAKQSLLTFVVVGGGPTGIESASEIHDLIHSVLLKRYPEIPPSAPSVFIVQSGNQILPGWTEQIVRTTHNRLNSMRINLVLGARVSEVAADYVQIDTGQRIQCNTAVWCSGIESHPLLAGLGVPLDSSGRIPVNPDLTVPTFSNVFVLGDAAFLIDEQTQKPLAPLAQVAVQQGTHCAKNIVRILRGEESKPFAYFNYGSLVSVGERYAAVQLLGFTLTGFLGWLLWRLLYLAKLVGASNQIRILVVWALDLILERSITQLDSLKQHSAAETTPLSN